MDHIPTDPARRTQALLERLTRSGESAFSELKNAVEKVRSLAPEDHDVVIIAHDVTVEDVAFSEPDTLIFRGLNRDGHRAITLAHYSQLVAHVVARPKRGEARIITGFSPSNSDGST